MMNKNKRIFRCLFSLCLLIMISMKPIWGQEPGQIRGTVMEDNGNLFNGVTVGVLDSTGKHITQSITDTKGLFLVNNLKVNTRYTLMFSHMGYRTEQESNFLVKPGNSNSLFIRMRKNLSDLEEVVVVGYGQQIKKEVTSSIVSAGRRELGNYATSNFTETLAGQLPGVQIAQVSGEPGEALNVRIRGAGSITAGNNPLYVVDGFPLGEENLNTINPADIQSIEVLKDASASAIYGSRGANGVVIISTERGQSGKTKVNAEISGGFQQLNKKVDVLNPKEYVDFAIDAIQRSWIARGGNADDPNNVRSPLYQIAPYFLSPDQWTYTDWQDAIYETAPISTYNVRVSGGQERVKYMVSGGYLDQRGILKNTGYKRYSFRANLDGQVSDRIHIGLSLSPNLGKNDRVLANGRWSTGAVGSALALPGFFPTQNADGTYSSFAGFGYNTSNGGNPMALVNETDGTDERVRFIGNTYATVALWKGLQYKLNLGVDYNHLESTFYKSKKLPDISDLRPGGSYQNASSINRLIENTLTYDWAPKDHRFNFLLGQSAQGANIKAAYIEGNNYPNDLVNSLNAAQITAAGNTEEAWTLASYFSRVNYAFKDRYFLSAAIRRDGSSRFGNQRKWGTFPSVSAGWLVSDEAFLSNVSFINGLKLRSSYGLTGNNFIPNYGAIGLLQSTNYVFGTGSGAVVNAQYAKSLSNPSLSWETSKQFDLGMDLSLFHNRIVLNADYYHKINADLLLDVAVPSLMGVESSLQNIGKVKNYGYEFLISTQNLQGKFSWKTTANLSINRNRVLELGPNGDPILSTSGSGSNVTHITKIGEPIGSFYGFVFDGVYNTVDQINVHAHLDSDVPGDPIIRDVNEDGRITMDDRTIIGNAYPDYTFGLKNEFRYKAFDLSVFLYGSQGGEILNLSKYFTASMTGRLNSLGEARDRWRSPEEPGNGKVFSASLDINGYRRLPSTFYLEDASFVRLRNITLGYNLANQLNPKWGITQARIYFSAQNLFTWSPYKMYNPEASMTEFNSQLTPGTDQDIFPLAKSFVVGLNLSF